MRGKKTMFVTAAAAVAVVVAAGVALQDTVREGYWAWIAEHGSMEERDRAIDVLSELRSPRAVPGLVERAALEYNALELDEERELLRRYPSLQRSYGLDSPVAPQTTPPPPHPCPSLEAILEIHRARPIAVESALAELVLSDDQGDRAFVCFVLMAGGSTFRALAPLLRRCVHSTTDGEAKVHFGSALRALEANLDAGGAGAD